MNMRKTFALSVAGRFLTGLTRLTGFWKTEATFLIL